MSGHLNSSSSTRTSMSSNDPDGLASRSVQELADHLNCISSEEKRRLCILLMDLVDDDTLSILGQRLEAEKKLRKKAGNKKNRENHHGHLDNSTNLNKISSTSMALAPSTLDVTQGGDVQATSPSAGSRKTFAGFLRSKLDKKRGDNVKPPKEDKKDKGNKSGSGVTVSLPAPSSASSSSGMYGSLACLPQTNGDTNPSLSSGSKDLDGISLDTVHRATDHITSSTSTNNTIRYDEEGYIIREVHSQLRDKKELDNFYSDDSDSSEEEDEPKKPISFAIRPVNGSNLSKSAASIAELKQTVKGLSLSPSLHSSKFSTYGPRRNQSRLKVYGNGNTNVTGNGNGTGNGHGAAPSFSSVAAAAMASQTNGSSSEDRYAALRELMEVDGNHFV